MVTVFVGLSNLVWLPLSGALSDRVGRRPVLLFFTILTILTSYPAVQWLVADPSFLRLLGVELWLSFLYGSLFGLGGCSFVRFDDRPFDRLGRRRMSEGTAHGTAFTGAKITGQLGRHAVQSPLTDVQ